MQLLPVILAACFALLAPVDCEMERLTVSSHCTVESSSMLVSADETDDVDVDINFQKDVYNSVCKTGNQVHTVCIMGPARTGKSTLANLLSNRTKLFQVGHASIHTKGAWISHEAYLIDNGTMRVHLVDTEGTEEKTQEFDYSLLTSVLPACDLILFNYKGQARAQEILTKFSLLVETFNRIAEVPHNAQVLNTSKYLFPPLVLVLRDWTFHENFTEEDYIRGIFDDEKGHPKRNLQRAAIRRSIQSLHAAFLPIPCSTVCLQKSKTLVLAEAIPEFQAAVEKLEQNIARLLRAPRRTVLGHFGSEGGIEQFLLRVELLCSQVKNTTINIPSVVETLVTQDLQRATQRSTELFESGLNVTLLMSQRSLMLKLDEAMNSSITQYRYVTFYLSTHPDRLHEEHLLYLTLQESRDRWLHQNVVQIRQLFASLVTSQLNMVNSTVKRAVETAFEDQPSNIAVHKSRVFEDMKQYFVQFGVDREYLSTENDPLCPECIPFAVVNQQLEEKWEREWREIETRRQQLRDAAQQAITVGHEGFKTARNLVPTTWQHVESTMNTIVVNALAVFRQKCSRWSNTADYHKAEAQLMESFTSSTRQMQSLNERLTIKEQRRDAERRKLNIKTTHTRIVPPGPFTRTYVQRVLTADEVLTTDYCDRKVGEENCGLLNIRGCERREMRPCQSSQSESGYATFEACCVCEHGYQPDASGKCVRQ